MRQELIEAKHRDAADKQSVHSSKKTYRYRYKDGGLCGKLTSSVANDILERSAECYRETND
jgi:hypothetical protein